MARKMSFLMLLAITIANAGILYFFGAYAAMVYPEPASITPIALMVGLFFLMVVIWERWIRSAKKREADAADETTTVEFS